MTAILKAACERLAARLDTLGAQLEAGDDGVWPVYLATANTLAALLPNLTPGSRGELLSTREMAERLGISSRTLLKRRKAGAIRPALVLGSRGRAAIRWRADDTPNGNGGGNAFRK